MNQEALEKDTKVAQLEGKVLEYEQKLARIVSQNNRFCIQNDKLNSELVGIKSELDKVIEENKSKESKIEEFEDRRKNNELSSNSKAIIQLNIGIESDNDMMKGLSLIKLPIIQSLRLDNIKDKDADLKTFFKNSCPPKLRLLCLNHYSSASPKIQYHIDCMKDWLSVTIEKIYLNDFKFSSEDLCMVIKSSSQCKSLIISNSVIDASQKLSFRIDGDYNLEYLSFQGCGFDDKSGWYKKKHELLRILKAIKNCGLSHSLKKISLHNYRILDMFGTYHKFPDSGDSARKIAEEATLDKSVVVFEQWSSTED